MTPVDILLGPTLLFDVVPLSICGGPPFPRRDPVSAGRRASHEAFQVRFT